MSEIKKLTSSSPIIQSIDHDYIGKYKGNIYLYHASGTHDVLSAEIRKWLLNELRGYRPITSYRQDAATVERMLHKVDGNGVVYRSPTKGNEPRRLLHHLRRADDGLT